MRLTTKLLGYLPRVFDKTPQAVLALRLSYDGSMRWAITDGRLTTFVAGGSGAPLDVDLAAHTLTSLVDYLAAQPGYSVPFESDAGHLSALALLDGDGDIAASNGDHLLAYTSLLWAWLEPLAVELNTAHGMLNEALAQLDIRTASGEWLDDWGRYFTVPRLPAEPDDRYRQRIVTDPLRVLCNNNALAQLIELQTGIRVDIVDLDWRYNRGLLEQLGITYADDGYPPWGPAELGHPLACAFGVLLANDQLSPLNRQILRGIIDRARAAGTLPLYFAPVAGLHTNVALETTNSTTYACGPAANRYQQIVF